MKKIIYTLLIGVFILVSCQDDEPTVPPVKSENPEPETPQTLLSGKWKMIKRETYQDGTLINTKDLKSPECNYNYYDLKSDGTKDEILHEPENNCTPENHKGTWSYDDSNKIITLINDEDGYELMVQTVSLTNSDLKVKIIREDGSSPPGGFEVYTYFEK